MESANISKKSRVSIVRVKDQDTYSALENAVELIGGLSDIISSKSRILIKPNMVMGPTERGITSSVTLEAVLRLISDMSPKSIAIGEGSADCYTWSVFRIYNIYDMATRYNAEVVDLNMDEGIRVEVPEETGRDYVMLPKTAAESDVVISIPTFKLWMGKLPMSLSLKNLFGLYGARYYGHNKNSHEMVDPSPYRTLEGEVGSERGIHYPGVEQSIAAINLACPSSLTVVDALEGSNGKGDYVRLDLLMVGKNAVATDSVALATAGFVPEEQEQIRLCSQMGLGPCRLNDIEVLGVPIEEAHFLLKRLEDNVLELPAEHCLERISLGELQIIGNALKIHGFIREDNDLGSSREEITENILSVMAQENYIERAIECLKQNGLEVLKLIVEHGGTSGNYFDILDIYVSVYKESNSFWAGLRSLMRLGLAYIFQGQYKNYIILTEGVTNSAKSKI